VESDYISPKKTSPRNKNKEVQESANPNYNPFSPLVNNSVKCYKCHKLGHKAYECRSKMEGISVQHPDQSNVRVWRRTSDQLKEEENNLVVDGENHQALHAQQRSNKWYVESGCS
jgi:hypothetical protein